MPESISIHAPASGATRKDLCCLQQGCDFNPRSREWSDRYIPVIVLLRHISIHAPASGATTCCPWSSTIYRRFQSTLPRVERQITGSGSWRSRSFQSTLPRVERQALNGNRMAGMLISIHAPASGATSDVAVLTGGTGISIHAPASGATVFSSTLRSLEVLFQSTLPRVERHGFDSTSAFEIKFTIT